VFSKPEEKNGDATITITHDILGPETRVVAVGLDGQEHRANRSGGSGAGKFKQITATFFGLPLKDIRVFRLQTRPYHWVEFRRVSLRLGQKTDVLVVQLVTPAGGPPAAAEGSATPELIKEMACLLEAVKTNPHDAHAHNNLADLLASLSFSQPNLTDEAIEQYREALKIKPDLAKSHNALGEVLAKMGRLEEAIAHYQEALRLKPDFAEAQENLDKAQAQKKGQHDKPAASHGD
jgi:tetratricopeptide (TPR) repeat protein